MAKKRDWLFLRYAKDSAKGKLLADILAALKERKIEGGYVKRRHWNTVGECDTCVIFLSMGKKAIKAFFDAVRMYLYKTGQLGSRGSALLSLEAEALSKC